MTPSAPLPPSPPPDDFNPYQPPTANITPPRVLPDPRDYPGIGRLACFGSVFIISFLSSIVSSQAEAPWLGVFVICFNLVPVYARLKNIGRNPWWCFLVLVPLISLVVSIPCLVLPAGYQDHRKLDLPAKIAAVLCVLFLIFFAWIFLR